MLGEMSIEDQAMNATNPQHGDDRLGIQFYMRTVEDTARSLAEGRKCFKEREFIRILVPGDRNNVVDRPVMKTGMLTSDDTIRFSRQYERFKANQEQKTHDGTPLTLWPQLPGPMAEELKFMNIFTVEQLADLADSYVAKVPMGHQWKQKAVAFVATMKDQEQVNRMMCELEERDNRIATLESAIAEQAEQIQELIKKVK